MKAQPLPPPAPDAKNTRLLVASELYHRLGISKAKFYKDRDSWILDPHVCKRGVIRWLEREVDRWIDAGTPDRETWRELRKQWKDLPASNGEAGSYPRRKPRRRPRPLPPEQVEAAPEDDGPVQEPPAQTSPALCTPCGAVLNGEFCPECGHRHCAACGDQ